MLEKINPEYRYASLVKIRPDWIRKHHFSALLIDVDNTLLPRNSSVIPEAHIKWMKEMELNEISMALTSNNGGKRLDEIARQLKNSGLSVPILTWAGKPFPRAYSGAIRLLRNSGWDPPDKDKDTDSILTIGDQLFTDVLGAHLYGLPAIWVRPLSDNDFIGTKLLRLLEKMVAGHLQQTGILPAEDKESGDCI